MSCNKPCGNLISNAVMIIVLITFLGWMLGGHTGAKLAFGGTIAASVLVVIFQIVFDLDEF